MRDDLLFEDRIRVPSLLSVQNANFMRLGRAVQMVSLTVLV